MNLLVLDNYDSFTYNLVQYIQEILGRDIDVIRNDRISIETVDRYDAIILSPGPGLPKDAGIMPGLIKEYAHRKAILGVCLGHQAIGEAFGGEVYNLTQVYHGIETPLRVTSPDVLFQSIPDEFNAGRYHSWSVRKENLPDCFEVTAEAKDGTIMAMRHKIYNVRGVQFHPESVMTEHGKAMLRNWLEYQMRLIAEREDISEALA